MAQVRADEAPFDLNRFHPALGTHRILGTDLAAVGPDWQLVPQLFLHYADRPMVLTLDGNYERAIVTNRVTGDLGIALSLKGRLQLGVSFPVTLTQGGEPLNLPPFEFDNMPVNPPDEISGTGLEDLRISLKGVFWQRGPYGVGAIGRLSLPTGDDDSYLGSRRPTFDARLIGHVQKGRLTAGAQVGWLFASTEQILLTRTGNALTFAVGAQYQVFQNARSTVFVAAELFGLAHSRFESEAESPLELLLAAKAERGDWTFFVGGGPGLTAGYGEPRIRVLAGASYAWTPPPPKPRPPVATKPEPEPETEPEPEPEPDRGPVWVESTITLPSGLLFEYDRCAILPESYVELRKLAKHLSEHPEWGNIRVEGHASQEGDSSDEYNLRLSRCRARRIAEFLEYHGVAKERLSYLGFGYRCPRAENDTEAGRVQNRRVDFVRNPEQNLPTCEIPPQLDPLPKHDAEPRQYLQGGAGPRRPDASKSAQPPAVQPPAAQPPAAQPPAAQPSAAQPPAAQPPAAQPPAAQPPAAQPPAAQPPAAPLKSVQSKSNEKP